MTSTTPAQSVLDAFRNASDGEYVEGAWVVNERTMLGAALRAAANLVGEWESAEELRAIASELEAN